MPIYEYECPKCGRFEVMESISKKPLSKCPQCAENGKSSKVQRVMSETSFHLKGGGWYKTDYSGKSKESKSEKSESSTSEAKTETKSEPKSESTTTDSKEKKSLKVKGGGGSCGGGCSCH